MGRSPMAQPPGRETRAFPRAATSGPAPGFATPEDAVRHFCEALAANDFDKAMDACAAAEQAPDADWLERLDAQLGLQGALLGYEDPAAGISKRIRIEQGRITGLRLAGEARARDWLRSKANSIEGGTSEIQLNIISKRILGLPGA